MSYALHGLSKYEASTMQFETIFVAANGTLSRPLLVRRYLYRG